MNTTSATRRPGTTTVTVLMAGVLAVALTSTLHGQRTRSPDLRVPDDTTEVQEVKLVDDTKLVGRIINVAQDDFTFRTLTGLEMTMPRRAVVSVRTVDGVTIGGQFWPDDPSDSRLFFGPSARVPDHGVGYFGIYELIVPSLGVGVGDVAMITTGMSLVPGLDLNEQVFFISPKVQLFDITLDSATQGGVQGAAGVFFVKPGDSDFSGGLLFGAVTGGNAVAAATVVVATPFSNRDGLDASAFIMLGGEIRATRNVKLITENWITQDGAVMSFGARWLLGRTTIELAAAWTGEGGGMLPLVNVSFGW